MFYILFVNDEFAAFFTTETVYVLVYWPRLILNTSLNLWSVNIPVSLSLIATRCEKIVINIILR